MVECRIKLLCNYFSIEAIDDTAYLLDMYGTPLIKVESHYEREYPEQVAQSVCISELSYIVARSINEGFFREIEINDILLLIEAANEEVKVLQVKEAYDKEMRQQKLIELVVKNLKDQLFVDLSNAVYGVINESNSNIFQKKW